MNKTNKNNSVKIKEHERFFSCKKLIVVLSLYINMTLAIIDRVLQLVFLFTSEFYSNDLKYGLLQIVIIKPVSLNFLFIIYLIFLGQDDKSRELNKHNKYNNYIDNISNYSSYYLYKKYNLCDKIKYLIIFFFSEEASFSLGIHYCLRSVFSKDHDSPKTTTHIVNFFHIILVSVPQIFAVIVNSNSVDYYDVISIISLMFSTIFIIWSIIYCILICCLNENYDEDMDEIIYE